MRIMVLDLHMFPDRGTLEAALSRLAAGHEVRRAAPAPDAAESEWDKVLADIRDSDLVITL